LGKSEWPTGAPGEWLTIPADVWEACSAPEASVGEPGPVPPLESAAGPEVPVWESWPGGIPPWIKRRGLVLPA
jgi:hypothetical protein